MVQSHLKIEVLLKTTNMAKGLVVYTTYWLTGLFNTEEHYISIMAN